MATIYNSDLTKELVAGAKLQQNKDLIPTQLAEKVVPVMEVNPALLRRCNVVAYKTGGGTIYTTPTDKDFFLVSVNIGATQTVVNKKGAGTVSVIPFDDTAAVVVAVAAVSTGAALLDGNSGNNSINLPFPLKLKRGSVIAQSTAGDAPTSVFTTIIGYTISNINI
jgi:hypothetical protein